MSILIHQSNLFLFCFKKKKQQTSFPYNSEWGLGRYVCAWFAFFSLYFSYFIYVFLKDFLAFTFIYNKIWSLWFLILRIYYLFFFTSLIIFPNLHYFVHFICHGVILIYIKVSYSMCVAVHFSFYMKYFFLHNLMLLFNVIPFPL